MAPPSPYDALVIAGTRLKQLHQVHAHLIITGAYLTRSLLLTKLASLSCSSKPISISSSYTRKLVISIPDPDPYLFDTLIRVSSKSGSQHDAVFFFNRMLLARLPPSNYTFTHLLKSCADISDLKDGKPVHSLAVVSGFGSDLYVQASLVGLYAKCGCMKVARKVFDKMPQRDVVAWNILISGYEQNGFPEKSIGLFKRMLKSGVEPDKTSFVIVLSACAQLGALELGSWVHKYIIDHGFKISVNLGTALINMYSRCGKVSKAREVFDKMGDKNIVTWTAMISGYGTHGHGKESLELFHLMDDYGIHPNEITFVTLLSACAHAGNMVDEGREILNSMSMTYGLVPKTEHHVCMVDLYGRAGLLNEAFDYIQTLKTPQNPAVWTAMLSACKMHKNYTLGVEVADKLLALEPGNSGHYVLLSNVYASAGKMDRVETIRNAMKKLKLKKHVGYSIVEVDQKTRLFSMGDKSHPETGEIYGYLDDLMRRISEVGYVPVKEAVLHELEEEETEYALRYHSEKLAIAFGLLRGKEAGCSVIRVVKNLRMCEDCHLAIKFVSRVTNIEISVRDKLRFHHFKDGVCSCGDYW